MSEMDVSRETGSTIGAHHCTGCGQIHGAEDQAAAVRIAEINYKRDVELARIGRGETRAAAELGAETTVAVAEIQAGAGVAETEALAEGIAEAGDTDTTPQIIDVPVPDAEPEVQESIEPRDDEESPPPAAEKKSSLSYWP